jgi:hypothetical protein
MVVYAGDHRVRVDEAAPAAAPVVVEEVSA